MDFKLNEVFLIYESCVLFFLIGEYHVDKNLVNIVVAMAWFFNFRPFFHYILMIVVIRIRTITRVKRDPITTVFEQNSPLRDYSSKNVSNSQNIEMNGLAISTTLTIFKEYFLHMFHVFVSSRGPSLSRTRNLYSLYWIIYCKKCDGLTQ